MNANFFYNILPTKNLGQNLSILTYSSLYELDVGQVVTIPLRSSSDTGLVVGQVKSSQESQNSLDESKIKAIEKVLPIKLSSEQMSFLKIFADNTFNSLNDTWEAIWRPYSLLTQKQWALLELMESKISNNNPKPPKVNDNVEFELETDYLVRIMYIIRGIQDELQKAKKDELQAFNRQLLIVFPERKLLNKIKHLLEVEIQKLNVEKENKIDAKLWTYYGQIDKHCKALVWHLISQRFQDNSQTIEIENKKSSKTKKIILSKSENQLDIILTTRAGLFLPFNHLHQIILLDEANSLYIQEQNSLYYDTREAIFLLNKAFLSSLRFISPLPSVRLYNFYSQQSLDQVLSNYSAKTKKPLNVQITKYDKKSAKFNLFGWSVEQMLKPDEEL
jgi:primosomal protein N'